MRKSDLYKNIERICFIGTCSSSDVARLSRHVRYVANKKKVHEILIASGYGDDDANEFFGRNDIGGFTVRDLKKFYNPYKYWIDENYINVVHSGIDHLFEIERKQNAL